jgi:hypothetical protein
VRREAGLGSADITGSGSAQLMVASSADVEQGGVEGLKRLFALLVALVDVGRKLNECLLVTLECGSHALLVLFQKERRVVANQRRLLEPRKCANVQNLLLSALAYVIAHRTRYCLSILQPWGTVPLATRTLSIPSL